MKVVALISGGKDSCFNMMTCVAEGHDVIALANLRPHKVDELDSYMYQTVGHHAIDLYADAMDLPLYVATIKGSSLSIGRDYVPCDGDEVEDLYELLSQIKTERGIEGVSVGAILSDYQRVRVENVCQRLGLKCLAYLWRRNQEELLREMIACDLKAIIIKVAALGLLPDKHLGMELKDIFPHMIKMREKFGLNECGEGGEYETFVFDCPLFKKSILIENKELVIHSDDAFAPVGYLNLKNCCLIDKPGFDVTSVHEKIAQLPLSTTAKWLSTHITTTESLHTENTLSQADAPSQEEIALAVQESKPVFNTDGSRFHVSGLKALRTETTDVAVATTSAMEALKGGIENMGFQMSDMVSVSLYVGDMSNYTSINSVYKNYFTVNPPTRICLKLPLPSNVLFQLDCQGIRSDENERKTMYVQSLSLWAPANLGPFSQTIKEHQELYVSGTTAIVPSTLKLIPAGIEVQTKVALIHLLEKLVAVWPACTLSHCPLLYCFVNKRQHIFAARRSFENMIQEGKSGLILGDLIDLHPLVQYCVIPGMPQGAQVEWQTCAWALETKDNVNFIECKKILRQCSVSFHCTWCQDLFSCKIEVIVTDATSKIDLQGLFADLLTEYCDIKAANAITGRKGFANIFYPAGRFSVGIIESLNQAISRVDRDRLPTFAFVPVSGLETEKHCLVWCQ